MSIRLDPRVEVVLNEHRLLPLLPVQQAAINAGLLDQRSLILVAPTSSGKTVIGEILAVHEALNRRRTAVLVPFKALAEERYQALCQKWGSLGIGIGVSTGDHPWYELNELESEQFSVVIFTYERFLSLVSRKAAVIRNFSCDGD